MKILNISFDDWANFSHENANALRSVGVDCIDVKRKAHAFGYETESRVATENEIFELIKWADIVQFMHSWSAYLQSAFSLGKKCIVYHTGTSYRTNPKICNDLFNPFVELTLTDQCEFMELGAKNIHYIATAINTDKIKPLPWSTKEKVTFAHYPSNSNVKGTNEIILMMNEVDPEGNKLIFDHNIMTFQHKEQLKRMSWCDVYIELFKPTLYGKPYGCYGVTAFEAAALGKIVITNNIHEEVYIKTYGGCALIIANNEVSFKNAIEDFSNGSEKDLKTLGQFTREWVVEKHSYQATGNYLKKLLNL